MLLEELKNHYGTYADMNRALCLGHTSYLVWKRRGFIPFTTQLLIERKTNQKFIAKEEDAAPKKS